MAEVAQRPASWRQMRRGIPAVESSRKDLDMQHNRDLFVTIAKPLPISMVSSMKQKEVEELLQWVEELEQAEAWLLGKKKAAENVSSMAARGGASAASVFFSYIF
ncbi:hypothetical protein BDA96_03G201500 [Sorghum bicolor]|uniref:Uncharacterized protein n=2 Tax=Sorghum bicolor TaxID=4558 RepID=A0A921UP02_SORBI|nr:hypothetical protein BDA96_03G201500 [Sorghum bicolor]KXG32701.1 hypothetical protein SORBI_3003G185800 [Sorghum bicolor]